MLLQSEAKIMALDRDDKSLQQQKRGMKCMVWVGGKARLFILIMQINLLSLKKKQSGP